MSTARVFFARMLFTRRELSPAGRALVRAEYLRAVERELERDAAARTREEWLDLGTAVHTVVHETQLQRDALQLALMPPRTPTVVGMPTLLPADRYHTHTRRR